MTRGCHLSGTIAEDDAGPYEVVCLVGKRGCRAHAKVDPGWNWRQHNWHVCGGYASCSPKRNVRVNMHRLVINAPVGRHVDHANGDILDNRSANLRVVTPSQNSYNRVARGGSPYKGVSQNGSECSLWRISVGGFTSAEDAARAFDQVVRRYHGAHGTYNFPRPGERSAITGKIVPG